jgi:glutaredoxin
MAKDFFRQQSIAYKEVDVAEDLGGRQEMIEKSGQLGVPVIDVAGQIIIGFDKPRLTELLEV